MIQAKGGGSVGYGHFARTAALAEAMNSLVETPVQLLWNAPADEHEGVIEMFSVDPILLELEADVTEARQTLGKDSKGSSVLVTDLLDLQREDIESFRAEGFSKIVHINDSGPGRVFSDMLIDCDAFKRGSDYPEYGGQLLIGAKYKILSKEIRSRRPVEPRFGAPDKTVLFSAGGSDPDRVTEQFLQSWCSHSASDEFSLTCVIGTGFGAKRTDEIDRIAGSSGKGIRLFDGRGGLADEIVRHGYLISLGGITNYESACLGVPSLAIETERLHFYVRKLDEAGLLKNLSTVDVAVNQFDVFSRSVDIERFTSRAWEMCDGMGAERVAAEVSGLVTGGKC